MITKKYYYDKILHYFEEEKPDLRFLDRNAFVISLIANKGLIIDLNHFSNDLDFIDLDPSHELQTTDIDKVLAKMKLDSS